MVKRRMRRSYGRRRSKRARTMRRGFKGVKRNRRYLSTVHSFKRMTTATQLTGNAVYLPYLGNFTYNISNVINSTEFTNLYDQYRLNFIVIKLWLKIDPSAQAAGSASYPKLYWYRDLDDSTAPASLNEVRENQRSRVAVMNPNRPVVIKFRPNSLVQLYATAVLTTYKPAFKQWLDCAVPTATHYGIKFAIDDLTNTNYKVDIETTVYFQCRNAR